MRRTTIGSSLLFTLLAGRTIHEDATSVGENELGVASLTEHVADGTFEVIGLDRAGGELGSFHPQRGGGWDY